MTLSDPLWLDALLAANEQFCARIQLERLPVQRLPGLALITCMDPRINLEAVGIDPFTAEGAGRSSVRVIRTAGAMIEPRSTMVACFVAGIREFAILMHTDCAAALAYENIDPLLGDLQQHLPPEQFETFRSQVGEPFRERLLDWLKVYADPREAVQKEVAALRALPFAPPGLTVHGLVYDLATGRVEVVVNGYRA